jgi:hypothetical protein
MNKLTPKRKKNGRKRTVNIRADISEMKTKRTIQRISETMSLFFVRINKIDKLLAKLTKRKKDPD